MARRLSAALMLSAAALVAACTKPTDAVIPSEMAAWDKELAPVVQKLGEDDRKHFVAYVTRVKMGEVLSGGKVAIPFGTTVGQAIDEQKKWAAETEKRLAEEKKERERKDAEAAALKAKLDAERAVVLKKINDAVTVTLLKKQELPSDYRAGRYSEYQQVTVGVQNNSPKPVIGVAGAMEFIDVFDKVVGSVNFKVSERIQPGATYRWVGGRDYNQFRDEHRAIWNLEEGKYKTRFVPSTIIYADGEKVSMPE